MLIERYVTDEGWRWRVGDTKDEPSCKRLAVDGWNLLIIGAYPPATLDWLEQGIRDGKAPTALLKVLWERFEGHYAIAFLRDGEDLAIVGVDPYAIAKVYIHSDEGHWLIGTHLPELLDSASHAARALHPHALTYFLLNGYTPACHTFYSDVMKIPPGTIMTVRSGKKEQLCYLDIRQAATVSGDEYLARIHESWENSLENYLNSYKSYHVALSGGVDSTLLLASLLRLGANPDRLVAKTGVQLGGNGDVVLNPFDKDFATRVASDYKVQHELIHYNWSDKHVLGDFRRTVEDLGIEKAIGSSIFQALTLPSYSDELSLYAAQNADSIFSFATIGWPMLKAKPPFIAGLGGWVTRFNLFGGLDRKGGLRGFAVRTLLDVYLRRNYQVHLQDRTLIDRMFGMVFNPLMWPVHLNEQKHPYLKDVAGMAEWFEQEYILEPELPSFFEQNPHGAFVWLFLHNYMQGSANRGTVWPTSIRNVPTFLPFASLDILRLTAKLIPDSRFSWYGKYAVRWLAQDHYHIPKYVVQRSDPDTSNLDELMLKTFFSNPEVYDYFYSFFPREAKNRLDGIVDQAYLNKLVTQFENKQFDEANLPLILQICWLLTLEQLAWG